MKTVRTILITVLVCIAILFMIGILIEPRQGVPVVATEVVKTDTLIIVDYIDKDPVYIEREVIVRDTIYINNEGDSTATGVAGLDTAFVSGDKLSVLYYIEPKIFSVEFAPAPAKIQTATITERELVYVDSSAWWDKALVGAVCGSLFTAIITSLVN